MPIDTGVPTSIKRPGAFAKFLFSTAARGLTPLPIRVLNVGVKSAAGTATVEQPVQIFDPADSETKCGKGSELDLMNKKSFRQAALQGTQPEVWCCPIAAPAGTAAAKTLTFSGTATEDGNVQITIAGRTITAGVSNGHAAATVASAVKDAIQAMIADLPVTAGVVGAVVTATHVTAGVNGNEVDYATVKLPAGIALAYGTGAAGTGTVDITNALDNSLDKDYDFIAIGQHTSTDITDATSHTGAAWGYAQKRYRWIFVGDPSTLSAANTLSAAANNYTVIVVSCEDAPNLPGEIATAAATYVAGKEAPNANYDSGELDLYPPAAGSVYTITEIESALSAGTTPLIPTSDGTRLMIVRLVTTKITTSSAPDFSTFDLATSRTAAFMARQIDARYLREFSQEVMVVDEDDPENVLRRVKDMVVGIHYDMESLGYIRNVDDYVPQIQVAENISVAGRLDVINPFRVVSPLHQGTFLHHAYI